MAKYKIPGNTRTSKILQRALKHFKARQFHKAYALCHQILQNNPEHAEALHLYGLIAHNTGRYTLATEIFTQAIRYKPTSSLFHKDLGTSLLANGRREEANHIFRIAVHLDPNYKDGIRNLSDSLEKSNELQEAQDVINRGLENNPGDPYLLQTLAKLARRKNNYPEVIRILVDALHPHPDQNLILAGEINQDLGQAYDRLGDTSTAYQHFVHGNRLVAEASAKLGINKEKYDRMIDDLDKMVTPELCNITLSPLANEDHPPVFLVGFPRSGTTLLDQILSAHPELIIIEEKPTVDALHEAYCKLDKTNPPALASLEQNHIQELRKTYFSARDILIRDKNRQIVVDKMPLNSWRLPLLWRIFPEAKFILAIRHPCDVCLSCFMQFFAVTSAMSNFFTLEEAAEFYAKVIGRWIKYANHLPVDYHTIRYEDLVDNVEAEARNIIKFIGLEWDDRMLLHTQTASKRKAINTPSYHQVTQPIYKHARYRWKRYEKQLEPVIETLAPFIEYFGYSD